MKSKLFLLALLPFLLASAKPKQPYTLGDTVEDFELLNIDGETLSLSDFEDEKGLILIFDSNTCPYSKGYRERIKDLHKNYKDKGFPVMAINANDEGVSPGDSFDEMVSYAKEHNYKHDYLKDEEQSVAKAFGAAHTPHVFVLQNIDGQFRIAYIGAIDNNVKDAAAASTKYVEDAVDALLSGKQPEIAKTKAIGCTIKWKK